MGGIESFIPAGYSRDPLESDNGIIRAVEGNQLGYLENDFGTTAKKVLVPDATILKITYQNDALTTGLVQFVPKPFMPDKSASQGEVVEIGQVVTIPVGMRSGGTQQPRVYEPKYIPKPSSQN